ncbi:hypothetical protein KY358_02160 [Candidatus Woesearchaeota archaeon]|nr:hypothetical protein [Candidatus Woesearchaeota archaeon]
MKKRILYGLIIIFIFLASSFLASSLSGEDVKDVLKLALFEHFEGLETKVLTVEQTGDLLDFYEVHKEDNDLILTSMLQSTTGTDSGLMIADIFSTAELNFTLREEEEPQESCQAGSICLTDFHSAYQDANCRILHEEFCEYGCTNGQCNYPPETAEPDEKDERDKNR